MKGCILARKASSPAPCGVISLLQVLQQAPGGRERFRPARGDVWHGLHALLRLSHAAALVVILREAPALLDAMLSAATSAEQRSFVAVACLNEVFTTLGSQVMPRAQLSMHVFLPQMCATSV